MTDVQSSPFPPDVSWYLDCALEHGELDGGTHIALRLYALRKEVTDIIDEVPKIGHYLSDRPIAKRLLITSRLADLADRLLADVSIDRRGAIAWYGIQHIKTEINSLAWCCATWAIEDEIKGGCLKPFKRTAMSNWQRRYELSPKLRRRLYGQNWIRRYVKSNRDAISLRAKGTRAFARMNGVNLDMVRRSGDIIARDLNAQHENYRRWNEHTIRNMAVQFGISDNLTSDRSHLKKTRRVLKRAASTAVAIVGRDATSDFVAGRLVTIKGKTINLEVGRIGSSAMIGHSGIHVTASCPLTGSRLADLCVYHEKTPALDQLTAIHLAMQAGEEFDIIKTANLSRVTDAGRLHPLIQERGISERRWRPRDEVQEKNEAYWVETKQTWIDTLGVFVLGRMWDQAKKLSA